MYDPTRGIRLALGKVTAAVEVVNATTSRAKDAARSVKRSVEETARPVLQRRAYALLRLLAALSERAVDETPPTDQYADTGPPLLLDQMVRPLIAAALAPPAGQVALIAA